MTQLGQERTAFETGYSEIFRDLLRLGDREEEEEEDYCGRKRRTWEKGRCGKRDIVRSIRVKDREEEEEEDYCAKEEENLGKRACVENEIL